MGKRRKRNGSPWSDRRKHKAAAVAEATAELLGVADMEPAGIETSSVPRMEAEMRSDPNRVYAAVQAAREAGKPHEWIDMGEWRFRVMPPRATALLERLRTMGGAEADAFLNCHHEIKAAYEAMQKTGKPEDAKRPEFAGALDAVLNAGWTPGLALSEIFDLMDYTEGDAGTAVLVLLAVLTVNAECEPECNSSCKAGKILLGAFESAGLDLTRGAPSQGDAIRIMRLLGEISRRKD